MWNIPRCCTIHGRLDFAHAACPQLKWEGKLRVSRSRDFKIDIFISTLLDLHLKTIRPVSVHRMNSKRYSISHLSIFSSSGEALCSRASGYTFLAFFLSHLSNRLHVSCFPVTLRKSISGSVDLYRSRMLTQCRGLGKCR